VGGAFVMMLACDARIASEPVKLALSEVTAGIPCPACPLEIVNAEMEPGLRRHIVLSGDPIDPAQALERGIVDEVLPRGELVERAVELAQTRAAAPRSRRSCAARRSSA
jgi:enoyl-CoA hydratase/carnithine racemase